MMIGQKLIQTNQRKFEKSEYAVSEHVIVEGGKDGIAPTTVDKLEKAAIMETS